MADPIHMLSDIEHGLEREVRPQFMMPLDVNTNDIETIETTNPPVITPASQLTQDATLSFPECESEPETPSHAGPDHFHAGIEDAPESAIDVTEEGEPSAPSKAKKRVELELMHRRLGHRAVRSLLMADANEIYEDTKLVGSTDSFCETCHITTI